MYKLIAKNETLFGLAKLLSVMKGRIWIYGITLVGASAVFAICLNSLMAIVLKDVTEAALRKDVELLKKTIFFAGLLVLITSVLAPSFIYLCIRCIKNTMAEMRLKIYNHVVELPMSFYDNSHSGAIISNLTNDLNTMESAYFWPLFNFLLSFIGSASSIIIMFSLNKLIAGVLLALGVIAALINALLTKPLKKLSRVIQELRSVVTERMIDLLSGYHVIKIFNIHEKIVKIYRNKNRELSEAMMRYSGRQSLIDSSNYFIKLLSFIGMVVLGAYLSIKDIDSLGTTVACIRLQGGVTSMFLGMGGLSANLQRSIAGASRIFSLLEEPVENWEKKNVPCHDEESALVMKDVVFGYDADKNILDGLNISVAKGQMAAIVGGSGEGKSTLIKLLMGFYKCKDGHIGINGRSLESHSLEELRNIIAYVPQDAFLFSGTILENISYGNKNASKEEIIECAKAANAHSFIMDLPDGYDTVVGERGAKLSGGQRQRIAIARAFLKNAPILLLDEAVSGLDSKSEENVYNALRDLKRNRTVIIISHRLSTVEECDVIYVLNNGRVEEHGRHYELIKNNGKYRLLYDLHFRNIDNV